jgi:hypothetical protein
MITRRSLLAASCAAPLTLSAACQAANPAAGSGKLLPYRSEAEFNAALERWRSAAQQRQAGRRRDAQAAGNVMAPLAMQAAPSAAPPAPASLAKTAEAATAPGAAADSITNVQTAGVDEGGIVKRAGDHLVILRRGRLFTVRVGGDQLLPVASIDAFAPGSDPSGAWYDELLISGSTLVVIGYSYARGGTEIGLFELGADGAMSYRATYQLRSFDYYSSRNYASRLIGRKLVFYSPTLLQPWGPAPLQLMPGFRRWGTGALPADFERILPATRIYRSDDDFDPAEPLALHTVTSCDLDAPTLRPESTAVLGPAGRVFYVSQGSVYVWTSPMSRRRAVPPPDRAAEPPRALSAAFRIPLDGAAPTGLKTAGVPIDQMSFLEDAQGHLNVLLRDNGDGEGMWGSERGAAARMALLRVPLANFGDGRGAAQREHYRALPALSPGLLQNRFVGDWLLWGGAPSASPAAPAAPAAASGAFPGNAVPGPAAWALRFADSAPPQPLAPGHAVERIEAMGEHAVLVGNAGADLHFSAVRLGRGRAALAGRHVEGGARQGETRSHGFFFRPTGVEEGLLGLPVLQPGGAGGRSAVYGGAQGSASVVYLRQRELSFAALGMLQARPGMAADDDCKASCVDWYGNARPIFLGERVFALLGYEVVEGAVAGRGRAERIDERRRISFAPGAARNGRYSPFN